MKKHDSKKGLDPAAIYMRQIIKSAKLKEFRMQLREK